MVALSCPSLTCRYYTGEVAEIKGALRLIEMHVDMYHAAVNVNTIDEAVEEEVVNASDEAVEAEVVNDEVLYIGLFGYTEEDARKRQHQIQQFQQGLVASTKLTCPASTTTTEEIVEVVRRKPGSKSAKRRQRIKDAKRNSSFISNTKTSVNSVQTWEQKQQQQNLQTTVQMEQSTQLILSSMIQTWEQKQQYKPVNNQ